MSKKFVICPSIIFYITNLIRSFDQTFWTEFHEFVKFGNFRWAAKVEFESNVAWLLHKCFILQIGHGWCCSQLWCYTKKTELQNVLEKSIIAFDQVYRKHRVLFGLGLCEQYVQLCCILICLLCGSYLFLWWRYLPKQQGPVWFDTWKNCLGQAWLPDSVYGSHNLLLLDSVYVYDPH